MLLRTRPRFEPSVLKIKNMGVLKAGATVAQEQEHPVLARSAAAGGDAPKFSRAGGSAWFLGTVHGSAAALSTDKHDNRRPVRPKSTVKNRQTQKSNASAKKKLGNDACLVGT